LSNTAPHSPAGRPASNTDSNCTRGSSVASVASAYEVNLNFIQISDVNEMGIERFDQNGLRNFECGRLHFLLRCAQTARIKVAVASAIVEAEKTFSRKIEHV
jgi:hypothetical protein